MNIGLIYLRLLTKNSTKLLTLLVKKMNNQLLFIVIFIIEIINSFCSDTRNVKVTHQKEWEADLYDAISSACTWAEGLLVYVAFREWHLAIPSIIASVIGTHFAARRMIFSWHWPFVGIKKRKKRLPLKKTPATTA